MNTLIIAPHPDDELLGCGGLARVSKGMRWLSMATMTADKGWSQENDERQRN